MPSLSVVDLEKVRAMKDKAQDLTVLIFETWKSNSPSASPIISTNDPMTDETRIIP